MDTIQHVAIIRPRSASVSLLDPSDRAGEKGVIADNRNLHQPQSANVPTPRFIDIQIR